MLNDPKFGLKTPLYGTFTPMAVQVTTQTIIIAYRVPFLVIIIYIGDDGGT